MPEKPERTPVRLFAPAPYLRVNDAGAAIGA